MIGWLVAIVVALRLVHLIRRHWRALADRGDPGLRVSRRGPARRPKTRPRGQRKGASPQQYFRRHPDWWKR